MSAIRVRELGKSYGKFVAVKDVSFTVETGQIFGLLGPNGSGKTTTLRCLSTLTMPDRGDIEVCGFSVLIAPQMVRDRLGFVAQEVALDKLLTGGELLKFQADLYHIPKSIARPRIAESIELLALADYVDRQVGTYSGGLRRRLDLAAGLLHRPPVLVLDEPTVGLDIESRAIVWQVLRDLRQQGTTILLSSHYLEEVDILADAVGIIDRGTVVAAGVPSDLKKSLGGDRVTLKINEFTASSDAKKAENICRSLEEVKSATVNADRGNTIDLIVANDATNILDTLRDRLAAADLPLFAISRSQPSLDDVYLAATGRTLSEAELAAIATRDLKAEKKQAMRS
jgi:ABC-2 type transport system ATP-binding protein